MDGWREREREKKVFIIPPVFSPIFNAPNWQSSGGTKMIIRWSAPAWHKYKAFYDFNISRKCLLANCGRHNRKTFLPIFFFDTFLCMSRIKTKAEKFHYSDDEAIFGAISAWFGCDPSSFPSWNPEKENFLLNIEIPTMQITFFVFRSSANRWELSIYGSVGSSGPRLPCFPCFTSCNSFP